MNKESKIEFTLSENFGLFREGDPIIICNNLKPKDIYEKVIPSRLFDSMEVCILYVDGIYYTLKIQHDISLEGLINHRGYRAVTFPIIRKDIERLDNIFHQTHNDPNYKEYIDAYIKKIHRISNYYYGQVVFINCKLNELKDYFPDIYKFHKINGEKIKNTLSFSKTLMDSINKICDVQGIEIAKTLIKAKLEKISKEI